MKPGSGLLLAICILTTIASVPLGLMPLLLLDTPDAFWTLSTWTTFLTLLTSPGLAFAASLMALADLDRGSAKMRVAIAALLVVPLGTLLFVAGKLSGVLTPPPACPARPALEASSIRDARCR